MLIPKHTCVLLAVLYIIYLLCSNYRIDSTGGESSSSDMERTLKNRTDLPDTIIEVPSILPAFEGLATKTPVL